MPIRQTSSELATPTHAVKCPGCSREIPLYLGGIEASRETNAAPGSGFLGIDVTYSGGHFCTGPDGQCLRHDFEPTFIVGKPDPIGLTCRNCSRRWNLEEVS